ncbi:hypothetical protein LXL04_030690 [Taraxacum kok-saghyz]
MLRRPFLFSGVQEFRRMKQPLTRCPPTCRVSLSPLLKQFVVADPEIQEEKIDEMLEFLILASDGIWDVVTNEEAVAMIKPIQSPEQAAKTLMQEASRRGSADNITRSASPASISALLDALDSGAPLTLLLDSGDTAFLDYYEVPYKVVELNTFKEGNQMKEIDLDSVVFSHLMSYHLSSNMIGLLNHTIHWSIYKRNETLYYRVLIDNIEDFAPIIYTPIVGLRQPRLGAEYISIVDELMEALHARWPKAIVQTSNSSVLLKLSKDTEIRSACSMMIYRVGVLNNAYQAVARMAGPDAKPKFFLLDKNGLVTKERAFIDSAAAPFAKDVSEIESFGLTEGWKWSNGGMHQ